MKKGRTSGNYQVWKIQPQVLKPSPEVFLLRLNAVCDGVLDPSLGKILIPRRAVTARVRYGARSEFERDRSPRRKMLKMLPQLGVRDVIRIKTPPASGCVARDRVPFRHEGRPSLA